MSKITCETCDAEIEVYTEFDDSIDFEEYFDGDPACMEYGILCANCGTFHDIEFYMSGGYEIESSDYPGDEREREYQLMFVEMINDTDWPDDEVAKNEAWNNWTDMLCKDNEIFPYEYETWCREW